MAQTRKDLRGRVLRKGESQRRSDGRYVYNMNILVDSGLKKKIQIENRKNRRGIYYLWLFEKIFLHWLLLMRYYFQFIV